MYQIKLKRINKFACAVKGDLEIFGGGIGLFLTNLLADLFRSLLVIHLNIVTNVHTLECTSGNRIVEGNASPKLDSFQIFKFLEN